MTDDQLNKIIVFLDAAAMELTHGGYPDYATEIFSIIERVRGEELKPDEEVPF